MKIMSALTSTEVTPPSERMLRLDPGEGRIRTARNFQVLEGGGEYNTSRGLCKGFGYLPKFVSVPTGINNAGIAHHNASQKPRKQNWTHSTMSTSKGCSS